MASVSTICIVGFPPEQVLPRELKNLCRFMPGFEGAHVAFAGHGQPSSLFVKFVSPDIAFAALERLHGAPFDADLPQFTLKAAFARREMEVRAQAPLPPPQPAPPVVVAPPGPAFDRARLATPGPHAVPGAQPPWAAAGGGYAGGGYGGGYAGPPSKRVGTSGGELVTIVVIGVREKGMSPDELSYWFQERSGYVAHQMNDRIDGMFVKFATPTAAAHAMREANAQQLGAEWARRNLDDDKPGAPSAPPQPAPPPTPPPPAPAVYDGYAGYAGPPARRVGLTGGELVTIAVLGLTAKGVSSEDLRAWFQVRPGFEKLQVNDRIGALFVKFSSPAQAAQALQDANRQGYGAEWARRNLDDDIAAALPPAPAPAAAAAPASPGAFAGGYATSGGPGKRQRTSGGDLDTVAVLGLSEKKAMYGDMQQWFADQQGFVTCQTNERIDAMFVKFDSPYAAEQAMNEANALQYGVEWARRNLDL